MGSHLTVFTEVFSSNQVLWNGFSSLGKKKTIMSISCITTMVGYFTEHAGVTTSPEKKLIIDKSFTFFLSVVRIVALSCSWKQKKSIIKV